MTIEIVHLPEGNIDEPSNLAAPDFQANLTGELFLDENGPVMDGSPRNGSKRWCPGISGYPQHNSICPLSTTQST
jgi:hypothetical protein